MSGEIPGPAPQEKEPHIPSPEELQQGYVLQPEETIAVPIVPAPNSRRRSIGIGNGMEVTGTAVAEVHLGGDQTYTRGMVINTFNSHDRKDAVLILPKPDGQSLAVKLERGQLWGLGRRFEGQADLPDTVSGDHCAVGLDENDRLVIENHNPTNMTGIRTFGTR